MLTTEDFKKQIEILSNGKYLSYDEGKSAFEYIMTGNATDILISSFLTSLKIIFINSGISHDLIEAGADILVSGTTIFKENNGDLKKNIEILRNP